MRLSLLFIGILLHVQLCAQFRPLTTPYMFNKLVVNPAFAGRGSDYEVALVAREQWIGLPGAPAYQLLSVNTPANNRGGLGLTVQRSSVGVSSLTSINIPYSYSIKVAESGTLSTGFDVGYHSFGVRYTDARVKPSQSGDPSIPTSDLQGRAASVGLGLYFSDNMKYIGLAAPILWTNNDREVGNTKLPLPAYSYNAMAGYQVYKRDEFNIMVQGLTRLTPSLPIVTDINASAELLGTMQLGLGGRFSATAINAVMFTGGVRLGKAFVAISYDFPLEPLINNQLGSIELLASYRIHYEKTRYEGISPRFF